MRDYSSQWNALEVKLTSEVQILTYSDPWRRSWHNARLGGFVFPPNTRGVVFARKDVVVCHGSFRKNHIWAYHGQGKHRHSGILVHGRSCPVVPPAIDTEDPVIEIE